MKERTELSFEFNFKRAEEGRAEEVYFDIPEGVERIEIVYDYLRRPKGDAWENEIDLAVVDNNGNDVGTRGTSAGRADRKDKVIVISPYYSINGYERPQTLTGKWKIFLVANRLREDSVAVTIRVYFYYKAKRWYCGDPHTHTVQSDGGLTYARLCRKAKQNGLEFIIVTDHNRPVIGELPALDHFTSINGVELTYYGGHFGIWGVQKPYSGSYIAKSLDEALARCNEARERGALVAMNHPMDTKCPFRWEKTGYPLDLIEVWNGPQRTDNVNSLDWWHTRLVSGERIPATGGSDYHRDYVVTNLLGRPATYVLSEGRAAADILDAFKKGRTTISNKPGGTFLELTSGAAVIGDSVPFDGKNSVSLKALRLSKGDVVRLYDKEGVFHEHRMETKDDYTVTVPVRGKGFVRADVRYNMNPFFKFFFNIALKFMLPEQAFKPMPPFVRAFCSPIYFD